MVLEQDDDPTFSGMAQRRTSTWKTAETLSGLPRTVLWLLKQLLPLGGIH